MINPAVLAVAVAFWASHGRAVNGCVHLRIDPSLRPPVLGEAALHGCEVELAPQLFPARSRRARNQLCLTVIHEAGHTLGLKHTRRGVMAPRQSQVGYVPRVCLQLQAEAGHLAVI